LQTLLLRTKTTECGCFGAVGETGLPLLFIMALVVMGIFTVIGTFYSLLVVKIIL